MERRQRKAWRPSRVWVMANCKLFERQVDRLLILPLWPLEWGVCECNCMLCNLPGVSLLQGLWDAFTAAGVLASRKLCGWVLLPMGRLLAGIAWLLVVWTIVFLSSWHDYPSAVAVYVFFCASFVSYWGESSSQSGRKGGCLRANLCLCLGMVLRYKIWLRSYIFYYFSESSQSVIYLKLFGMVLVARGSAKQCFWNNICAII